MSETTLESINTHAIRPGDIIRRYGMKLLVDTEPQVSKAHRVETDDRGACLFVRALIQNWDDVVAVAEAESHSTEAFIVSLVRGDLDRGVIIQPRWTIQGNGLATWAREVASA